MFVLAIKGRMIELLDNHFLWLSNLYLPRFHFFVSSEMDTGDDVWNGFSIASNLDYVLSEASLSLSLLVRWIEEICAMDYLFHLTWITFFQKLVFLCHNF